MTASALSPYQYVVLRCVPRIEREEFVNVGVVLFCSDQDFLASCSRVDEARLHALDPTLDLSAVAAALAAIEQVCSGVAHVDFGAATRATAYGVRALDDDRGTRFGFLKAPRSTVIQPGPVHGGLTADPARELERLCHDLAG